NDCIAPHITARRAASEKNAGGTVRFSARIRSADSGDSARATYTGSISRRPCAMRLVNAHVPSPRSTSALAAPSTRPSHVVSSSSSWYAASTTSIAWRACTPPCIVPQKLPFRVHRRFEILEHVRRLIVVAAMAFACSGGSGTGGSGGGAGAGGGAANGGGSGAGGGGDDGDMAMTFT